MIGGPVPNTQKYNVVSKGVWAWLRNKLSLVPNRSVGNPIQQTYRVPAPGSQPTNSEHHDAYTLPAADIAQNPYYKRDFRRAYPQTAVFQQGTVAGLLLYGSEQNPKIAKGAAGEKQLATVANNEVELTHVLKTPELAAQVLENGLPPLPAALSRKSYRLVDFSEGGMYDTKVYGCRTFK